MIAVNKLWIDSKEFTYHVKNGGRNLVGLFRCRLLTQIHCIMKSMMHILHQFKIVGIENNNISSVQSQNYSNFYLTQKLGERSIRAN